MKKRYILIDSENIQNRMFEIIDNARKSDRIIIFYTVYHSGRLEEYMKGHKIRKNTEFVECMAGTNALDVQLIGVLSYLIQKHPDYRFVIYSNDKGYHIPVRYWQTHNVDVEFESFLTPVVGAEKFVFDSPIVINEKEKTKSKKKKKKKSAKAAAGTLAQTVTAESDDTKPELTVVDTKPVEENETPAEETSEELIPEILYSEDDTKMTDEQYVYEICHSIQASDLAMVYRVLSAGFGVENSKTAYNRFKKDPDYRMKMEQLYYADKDKRVNTLMRAALRYNSMDAGVADEICRILDEKGTDNMQQVYLSFIQRMPGTVAERQAIYKVIKPYFSVLNNI